MGLNLLTALLGAEKQAELTGAIGLGAALRILHTVQGTDRYAVHRLVQQVRREQLPLTDRLDWAIDLCQRIDLWFSALREDFGQVDRFESEIDHLRAWHDHALRFAPKYSIS